MGIRVFQSAFGLWLLVMFLMTLFGWRPPESILSEAGTQWAEVNLRPDMMAALLVIYGVGAATFLTNRFVALGAAVQAPLAVNMAMYHIFVNQVLAASFSNFHQSIIANIYFRIKITKKIF